MILPSFSRHSQAQTTNPLTEGVNLSLVPDKRVVDITKSDDKITFIATLTKNGQPLANYPIKGVNGSELFPDKNGKIGGKDLKTDSTGKATFTYIAGNSVEDIVDVSAVANLALSSDQPTAQSLAGVAYAQSESTDEWSEDDTVSSTNTTIIRDNPSTSLYGGVSAQPSQMDTKETTETEEGTPSTGGDQGQTESD